MCSRVTLILLALLLLPVASAPAAEDPSAVLRALETAGRALKTMKANFSDAERMDFAGYLALESERHGRMFTYKDTREAFAAKVEKRAPRFEGR